MISSQPATPRGYWWAVSGLLALFALQTVTASRLKSPAYDEPAHITARLSYWQSGVIAANPQHPPLLKEIGTLPLWLAGIRLPQHQAVSAMMTGVPDSSSSSAAT